MPIVGRDTVADASRWAGMVVDGGAARMGGRGRADRRGAGGRADEMTSARTGRRDPQATRRAGASPTAEEGPGRTELGGGRTLARRVPWARGRRARQRGSRAALGS